jgi:hypothetical protein
VSDDPDELTEPETGASDDATRHEDMENFLKDQIGGAFSVLHELLSDQIHLDVLLFRPNDISPFWTLVTSGMSDLPMKDDGAEVPERFAYAELIVRLPANWFTENDDGDIADLYIDRVNWPIAALKYAARAAHHYGFWLGLRHTIPNGNPPEPYAPGVPFVGLMLQDVEGWSEENQVVHLGDRDVNFFALAFLTEEEMAFKLEHGGEKLEEMFRRAGVGQVIDGTRQSVPLELN